MSTPPLTIVYQDDSLLVVEKPAGIPCLPARTGDRPVAPTLSSLLVKQRPLLATLPDFGLAHRLDNDTSGLVVIAKTGDVFTHLRQQFSNASVTKEYTALVHGQPPDTGTIALPIAHHPRKKSKMVVDDEGRKAITHYNVLERYRCCTGTACRARTDYTLLCVTIATGVRHQIRVHLASAGFPLAGDRLYQNAKKRAEDALPLSRHFLHASRLIFRHPVTGKKVECTSELPVDLRAAVQVLSK